MTRNGDLYVEKEDGYWIRSYINDDGEVIAPEDQMTLQSLGPHLNVTYNFLRFRNRVRFQIFVPEEDISCTDYDIFHWFAGNPNSNHIKVKLLGSAKKLVILFDDELEEELDLRLNKWNSIQIITLLNDDIPGQKIVIRLNEVHVKTYSINKSQESLRKEHYLQFGRPPDTPCLEKYLIKDFKIRESLNYPFQLTGVEKMENIRTSHASHMTMDTFTGNYYLNIRLSFAGPLRSNIENNVDIPVHEVFGFKL